ncbi:hypothetical protein QCA50_002821 [Cerrena zonata]|uniref:Kinetochore protein Spc24 n=1 Tax=Cerrena zonata TaxID=2478898 RepID=A0AAW0GN27_9APHY
MPTVQETINAIKETIPIMDPEEDYMTIAEAEELMAKTEATRKKELDDAHAKLRALARILDAARVSATHANRLQLAKAINDAESALASKEAELARLKQETTEMEKSDPAAEHDLDATALRLALFKGLGFEPIMDRDGRMTKMLIRAQHGDVHDMSFDGNKTYYEYAHELWKLTSS